MWCVRLIRLWFDVCILFIMVVLRQVWRVFFSKIGSGLNSLVSVVCVLVGRLLMFMFSIVSMVYFCFLFVSGFCFRVKCELVCKLCIVLCLCQCLLWVLMVFIIRCVWWFVVLLLLVIGFVLLQFFIWGVLCLLKL